MTGMSGQLEFNFSGEHPDLSEWRLHNHSGPNYIPIGCRVLVGTLLFEHIGDGTYQLVENDDDLS